MNYSEELQKSRRWYLSHEILSLESDDALSESQMLVWEDLILINADSSEEAYQRARQHGLDREREVKVKNQNRRFKFEGLKDLVLIYDDLENGAEIEWREMHLKREEIEKLVKLKKDMHAFRPVETEGQSISTKSSCMLNYIREREMINRYEDKLYSKYKWYISHEILAFELVDMAANYNNKVEAWENLILINAEGPDEAYDKARTHGLANDQEVRIDGKKGRLRFKGLKDLVLIFDDLKDGVELECIEHTINYNQIGELLTPKEQMHAFNPTSVDDE